MKRQKNGSVEVMELLNMVGDKAGMKMPCKKLACNTTLRAYRNFCCWNGSSLSQVNLTENVKQLLFET